MVGAEFRAPDRRPDTAAAKAVSAACKARRLFLLTCGPWDNTIRWIPPLIVTEGQIAEALAIFEDALKEVAG